jgi:hypothetical protein
VGIGAVYGINLFITTPSIGIIYVGDGFPRDHKSIEEKDQREITGDDRDHPYRTLR